MVVHHLREDEVIPRPTIMPPKVPATSALPALQPSAAAPDLAAHQPAGSLRCGMY